MLLFEAVNRFLLIMQYCSWIPCRFEFGRQVGWWERCTRREILAVCSWINLREEFDLKPPLLAISSFIFQPQQASWFVGLLLLLQAQLEKRLLSSEDWRVGIYWPIYSALQILILVYHFADFLSLRTSRAYFEQYLWVLIRFSRWLSFAWAFRSFFRDYWFLLQFHYWLCLLSLWTCLFIYHFGFISILCLPCILIRKAPLSNRKEWTLLHF